MTVDQPSLRMFDLEFTSGPMAVRGALKDVIQGLQPLSLDGDELGTIELVLAEALNNVVEHAYPEDDPDGPITVACNHSVQGLHFQIIDRGRGMPNNEVPLGTQANVDTDMHELPEGGFGWFLIRDLAKDVHYCHTDGQNILDLRIAIGLKP